MREPRVGRGPHDRTDDLRRRDREDRLLPRRGGRRASTPRVAGEQVVSFLVHHEPTIDERDEVRRHITVRGADAEPADPRAHRRARRPTTCCPSRTPRPRPRRSGSSAVRSVVVNRMVANPEPYAGSRCRRRRHEAVLTIGWGGGRPASTSSRPAAPTRECDADHGYTGRARLRRLLAAGQRRGRRARTRSAGLLGVRRGALRAHRVTARRAESTGFVEPAYERPLAGRRAARGRRGARRRRRAAADRRCVLPEAPAYVVFLVDGLGYELLARPRRRRRRTSHSLLAEQQPGDRRGAVDDRDQPDLAGHRR